MVATPPLVPSLGPQLSNAIALHQKKNFHEARAIYQQILQSAPDCFDALQLLGALEVQCKNYEAALIKLNQAISIDPAFGACYANLGIALQELNRFDEAIQSFTKAISLDSKNVLLYVNQADSFRKMRRFDEAIQSYENAIGLSPDSAWIHNNKGSTLRELKRYEEAIQSYELAITLDPKFAEAYINLGNVLRELKHYDQAIQNYEKAITLNPQAPFLHGSLLRAKMLICDWTNFQDLKKTIYHQLSSGNLISSPFTISSFIDDPQIQKIYTELYSNKMHPLKDTLGEFSKTLKHNKIRIGYFSADFRDHPTSFLIAGLFEQHDKNQFEIIGFSYGPVNSGSIYQRLSAACHQMIDVSALSDQQIAQLARQLEIDIAVDLNGHTTYSRTDIFAYRAAPVQVNFLGFPGTMGAPYIDYIVGDQIIIPEDSRNDFTEKIIYLPHTYQVNDNKRGYSDTQFTRQELGLPQTAFVFCCFNNSYKILPETFDSWMRILRAVTNSVLWLFYENSLTVQNLRLEAVKRGVDPDRLIFAKPMPHAQHLARYRCADLFLDTIPYNAHTTASDALWEGVPIVTLFGRSFASRVAASILHAIQLPELIANTREGYENIAIGLASNPERLRLMKQKISNHRLTTPLFDTSLFARHLEMAYTKIIQRYWSHLEPEHVELESTISSKE